MTRPVDVIRRLTMTLLATTVLLAIGGPATAGRCLVPNADKDLVIDSPCDVPSGVTLQGYRYVNIVGPEGVLNFLDGPGHTHFWASAILVENGGKLIAGTEAAPIKTGTVTIHLWGAPQGRKGTGVLCKSPTSPATCGAPPEIFFSNVESDHMTVKRVAEAVKVKDLAINEAVKSGYPGVKDDYFYAYHTLVHDDGDHGAYFGYKVLGVGYGGTLQLFGAKGGCYSDLGDTKCADASHTGRSWVRLNKTVEPGATELTVEVPEGLKDGLNWTENDFIVLTTTDYLPGHSELLKVLKVQGNTIFLKDTADFPVRFIHNGQRFPLDEAHRPGISRVGLNADLTTNGAETRAAVGLLTRNIRIVSEGETLSATLTPNFPSETSPECTSKEGPETNKCYFGGHTVFRQGYKTVQIQGVEFYQMGQGGRLGHYPIHFHHARKTHNPDQPKLDTFVVDSAIWDSMTRWIVLHGTQDVTLARNVGYKSIGHGFYLEDATEINNRLLGNLGVFARAGIEDDPQSTRKQNPRRVPGILAAPDLNNAGGAENTPFRSDYDHPTVFWIMNGWNDFQYNMAAGAGTCGVCYWIPGPVNSTISRVLQDNGAVLPPNNPDYSKGRGPKWESYAAMQSYVGRSGVAPLKSFVGNSCTTAMASFQTVTVTEGCKGLAPSETVDSLVPIPNPLAANSGDLSYYPTLNDGGLFPALCPDGRDCGSDDFNTGAPRCGENNPNCVVTVLDRYTTSFNWHALNFAAIWLRPQWYLVTDSVITDSQQAGLTMVTGGGYEAASVIPGHWALVRKSVFIGNTQDCPTCDIPVNADASNGGPFNPKALRCAEDASGKRPIGYCLSKSEGISHQMSNFGMYQRLFSVYDGPAFQESNAYINITNRNLDDCKPGDDGGGGGTCVPTDSGSHKNSAWLAGNVLGLPKGYQHPEQPKEEEAFCYMPNAAIGWKQPNGFYYPPAFHSTNLFFHNVDTRHFVITPLFDEGTLTTNVNAVKQQYCKWNNGLFNGFNSNDRQTVLNDDDGSLTGYRNTTVINLDDFFLAPVDAIQCASENSSRTSPYEYVTTVVYPHCVTTNDCAKVPDPGVGGDPNRNFGDWNRECSNEKCYGIPLYRQDELPSSDEGTHRSIRLMGQNTSQRSSLTVNHGTYYLDTAVGKTRQCGGADKLADCSNSRSTTSTGINVFKANGVYYLFLIFAKGTTEQTSTAQTYQLYVGPTDDSTPDDPAQYLKLQIVQADIRRNPVNFVNLRPLPPGRATWHVFDKMKGPDKKKGVVDIVLNAWDLKGANDESLADLFTAARKAKCLPTTYCTWDDNTNTCREASGVEGACRWSGADVDCPEGGCFGIVFTMPAGFTIDPEPDPRPAPVCLPKAAPWSTTTLQDPLQAGNFTPQQVAGTCFQAPQLPEDFCR